MRISPISVASLCLLAVATAVPSPAQSTTAQQGGKQKHRAADTTQSVKADQTVSASFTAHSDLVQPSDQMLKSGTTVSSGETPAMETLSNFHVPSTLHSPLVVRWEFNDQRGHIDLIISQDGVWQFAGKYKNKHPGKDFDVVIALKDKFGTVFIFHAVYKAPKGLLTTNAGLVVFLEGEFANLTQGFDVRAAYRLPTPAEGAAEPKTSGGAYKCTTSGTVAAGWAPIWSWVEKGHKCFQFEA